MESAERPVVDAYGRGKMRAMGLRTRLGAAGWPAVLIVAGCVAALSGCGSSAPRGSMTVSPRTALSDVPVIVSLRGVPAGAHVTVAASAVDSAGITWKSAAEFVATPAGTVTLDQPSSGGSYTGRNRMGLFESMAPTKPTAPVFINPAHGYDVALRAEVDGQVTANATAHRQDGAERGLVHKKLRPSSDGIYGDLITPAKTTKKRPGLLVLGGSEGGILSAWVQGSQLAAHGYPALALAYFKAPGLPQTLANIPLEYFRKALETLRAQPGVDPRHVVVIGASRSAEAALLIGSHFPALVDGVVAGTPTSVVTPGFPDLRKPAWTLHGTPLPATGDLDDPHGKHTPNAVIPVEKIAGPVLLNCGGKDPVWPSCRFEDAITERLAAHHFRHPVTALKYPDGGHSVNTFNCCFSMTDRMVTDRSGSPDANRAAGTDSHGKLLAFLAKQ